MSDLVVIQSSPSLPPKSNSKNSSQGPLRACTEKLQGRGVGGGAGRKLGGENNMDL